MINEHALSYLNKHPLPPAPWDLAEPECRSCGWGNRETERCTLCVCETDARAAAVARVLLPALAELMWRRANHETLGGDRPRTAFPRTVVVAGPGETTQGMGDRKATANNQNSRVVPDGLSNRDSIYTAITRVGALCLPLALGSLAPLATMLGRG